FTTSIRSFIPTSTIAFQESRAAWPLVYLQFPLHQSLTGSIDQVILFPGKNPLPPQQHFCHT
ncbi:MAG: hypothetical protein WAU67_15310, partial [Terracidiphilus sp.]